MKKVLALFLCTATVLFCTISVNAHPGKTDAYGGHTNHETGEYHYHHGYSAHDHYDMDGDGDLDCPYNFDDQTNSNNSNSSSMHTESTAQTVSIAKKSADSTVTKSSRTSISWINIIAGILLFPIILLLTSMPFFSVYVFVSHIISFPCSWILRLIMGSLSEDENSTYAMVTANAVLLILIYAFFLAPAVEYLIGSPDMLALVLILIGIAIFIGVCMLVHHLHKNSLLEDSVRKYTSQISALDKRLADSQNQAQALEAKLSNSLSVYGEIELEKFDNERLHYQIQFLNTDILIKDCEISDLKEAVRTLLAIKHPLFDATATSTYQELVKQYATPEDFVPDDVYFINGLVPAKGSINSQKPFGDFTVYISERGTRYHSNSTCGGGFYKPEHIYNVIEKRYPCSKCVSDSPKNVPDWYRKIEQCAKVIKRIGHE